MDFYSNKVSRGANLQERKEFSAGEGERGDGFIIQTTGGKMLLLPGPHTRVSCSEEQARHADPGSLSNGPGGMNQGVLGASFPGVQ